MERIINGRADMESAAKELRRGEIKEYKIKLAKTGMYYKIDRDKLEAYLSGGDRKFYEEVGTECEPLLNPYYEGNDVVVAEEIDELDDLGEGEQAPETVEEVAEEVVEEVVENVAVEAIAEPSEEVVAEEVKPCECEAKIAELEREKDELVEKHNEKILELERDYEEIIVGLKNTIADLDCGNKILLEKIAEREAVIDELNKANVELTEKLQAPVEMTMIPLEKMVYEIAHRGFAVEIKYNK